MHTYSSDSKRRDVGTGKGYSTFTSNIVWFSELDELPMPIDLRRLDEGNGIEATLIEHKAKWQKSTYLCIYVSRFSIELRLSVSCSLRSLAKNATLRFGYCLAFNLPTKALLPWRK